MAQGFAVNVQLFVIAEVLVLICGLGIALLRTVPGPVFLPLRLLAVIYSDFFRGVPGVLFIFLFGFGVPALGLPGVPNDPFLLGVHHAHPALHRLRRGGLPGGPGVRPPEPGGSSAHSV